MKKNESDLDRILRLIAGFALIYVGYAFTTGILQIILYIVGAVSLFTAITGFCLLYKIFGINTMKDPFLNKKYSDNK